MLLRTFRRPFAVFRAHFSGATSWRPGMSGCAARGVRRDPSSCFAEPCALARPAPRGRRADTRTASRHRRGRVPGALRGRHTQTRGDYPLVLSTTPTSC
eukprot:6358101-Prymnesium_polylepis.1